MERGLYFVVSSMILIVALGTFTPVTGQNRSGDGEMIRQRMLNDIRSLKDQLNELNQTVNRLQKQLGRLQNQNQKQKNKIRNLRQRIDDRENDPEQSTNNTMSTSGNREGSNASTVWVPSPNVDYQIRREPLDREVNFVTTDDTILTELAHKYYRDSSYWRRIYEVNEDKLPSPDVVPPDISLRLPPVDELQAP